MTRAVLDACVLYPAALRDLLLWLAVHTLYQPRWTEAIHEEWIRSVLRDRPDLSHAQLQRTRELMDEIDPECLVTGYAARLGECSLPDPDDRHVLAAALTAEAGVIVTFNLSDFPASVLASLGVRALHPDTFLTSLVHRDPDGFIAAVREHRASLRQPPKTCDEYLGTLLTHGLKQTAAWLAERTTEW